jgi:hypothetical protein
MGSRFARPDTATLSISRGDTLTVKRRLNAGESRRLRAMEAAPTMAEPGVVMAYLVDWTIKDDTGHRVPIRGVEAMAFASALDALDEDAFDEIYAAVAAHRAAMQAERAAEKNAPDGETTSAATSPSRSVAAGPLTRSAPSMSMTTPA